MAMPDTQKLPEYIARVRTLGALREQVAGLRAGGHRIGFVPTMGALHDGHIALVREAKRLCGKVVVSIFVNPLQFAPTEDLDRYPRTEAADIARLQSVGCDLVYLPTPEVLYPKSFVSRIDMAGPALGLETDFRPQFFSGVATVVMKLFNQVRPDVAVFGEKDYQQLAVIRTMARDFDMDLEIVGHPTIREGDGLALSSRNAYLSAVERAVAPKLHQALQRVREAALAGEDSRRAVDEVSHDLIESGFDRIDYIAMRDADSLGEITPDTKAVRLLAAAWLGRTRLIDNIAV